MQLSSEKKASLFIVLTLIMIVFISWLIGVNNPFKRSFTFYITYQFAGGIELGSPVRVSGIKVGKVDAVDFYVANDSVKTSEKEAGSADQQEDISVYPVRLKVSVDKKAALAIKSDSKFYINLAGIIGERYIEITPGSIQAETIKADSTLAGVDPPRIDQLISQSFNLAQTVVDLIQKNKQGLSETIKVLQDLSVNMSKTLVLIDKSKVFKTDLSKLVNNLIAITTDVKTITDGVHSEEGKKTLKLLYDILWRLEPLDEKNIRKFLQQEGVRARIF